MTKTRSTKRALLLSALGLILCVSMLIGSTYAWFTDSVTSVGNKILAGTLDIQLLMDADVNGTYDDISDSTSPIFGEGSIAQNSNAQTLWEPGKTQVAYLAIKNNGNLALKYTVNLKVQNVSKDLYEVMEYAIVPDADANNKVTAWNGGNSVVVGTQSVSDTVSLPVGATHYFALAIHMDEEAGNEYQGGEVNFDLTVLATQLTSEEDSFDDQYDVFADFDGEVSNADSLATAFKKGGTYKIVSDIQIPETYEIPANVEVALDLNGKTISGSAIKQVHVIVNEGTLTIKDGTISSLGADGGSAIKNTGTLTATNVTLNGAPFEGIDGWWPSYGVNNTGTMTISDSVIIAGHGGIASSDNGVVTLNNVDITSGKTGTTSASIYTFNGGSVTVNGGTYTNRATDQNSTGASVINGAVTVNAGTFNGRIENYYGTPVIKGGTFSVNPTSRLAAGYDVLTNADGTYTVVKGNVVNNATNLKDALAADEDIVLQDDITFTGVSQTPDRNGYVEVYGNKVGFAQYEGVFDGNGKTITDAEGDKSYVFVTHGGTIKNLTIKNGARGIVTYAPTENVYIDNVVVDGPGYALNSTEHGAVDMFVTNSTINGWTSLGGFKTVNFTNCKLGENSLKYWQNMGYAQIYDCLFRVYSPTTYTKCEFTQGYYLDLSVGGTATLIDCTVNGVEITADNYADYITIELPNGKVLSDCVVFG